MKKIYSLMLTLLAFTGLMSSCSSKEDIVFDHERQQFETRADRILLEFIAPFGTTADEEIYITGAFNGDDEAIGDAQYLLTKAPNSNVKWGIYLDPNTFVGGKSLADGFRFYSRNQGKEFTTAGEEATHTDNPSVGSFTNIWGQRWESYYWSGGEQPEPEHDGFAVYVDDQTGWDALTLYMWGDENNLNGEWPGMEVTGEQTVNGVTYKYFDMGEGNTGLGENLIFSNAGSSQLADFAYTIDHDVYLHITTSGVTEIDPATFQPGGETPEPEPEPQPAGETVIIAVKNSVGYADPHLYVWGDSEACGAWPGAAPVKTTDNGWCLFEVPANGTFHPILNDNGSPQVDGPEVFTNGSFFFDVTTEWVQSTNTVTIQNNAGYTDPRLYAWGDGEIYGSWRGIKPTSNENGILVFPLPNDGGTYNLILNGEGDGVQQDISQVVANQSYSFTAN